MLLRSLLFLRKGFFQIVVVKHHVCLLKVHVQRGIQFFLPQIFGADHYSFRWWLGRGNFPRVNGSNNSSFIFFGGGHQTAFSFCFSFSSWRGQGIFQEGDVVMAVRWCSSSIESILVNVKLFCKIVVFSILMKLFLTFDKYFSESP